MAIAQQITEKMNVRIYIKHELEDLQVYGEAGVCQTDHVKEILPTDPLCLFCVTETCPQLAPEHQDLPLAPGHTGPAASPAQGGALRHPTAGVRPHPHCPAPLRITEKWDIQKHI